MDRPSIGLDGKIPCNCCNHKGMRHAGGIGNNKVYTPCDKCNGTKRRVPPPYYKDQAQFDAEKREDEALQERIRLSQYEDMTLEERVASLEARLDALNS